MTLTPTIPSSWLKGQIFAGHAFDLTPQLDFLHAVKVTIHYNEADIRKISSEDGLTLGYWVGF
jgi:hypothetical protein